MYMDDRTMAVYSLLADYLRSPSLTHLRADRSLAKIAFEIVTKVDQKSAVWKKWEGRREDLLAAAIECWIPNEDMLAFLNSLPGPQLTVTDLEQRMKYMIDLESVGTPEPKLELECLAIYRAESEAGTEMPAIIGRLVDFISSQFKRISDERDEEARLRKVDARLGRERRLLSYADCPWTQIKGSNFVYCRKNGRVFQLKPNSDNSWTLYRVQEVDDDTKGEMI